MGNIGLHYTHIATMLSMNTINVKYLLISHAIHIEALQPYC